MSRPRLFSSSHNPGLKTLITMALLLVSCFAFAQSYRGSIRGHVVDPIGSVMAGAKVTAKSNATGVTRETVTGIDGGFEGEATVPLLNVWTLW